MQLLTESLYRRCLLTYVFWFFLQGSVIIGVTSRLTEKMTPYINLIDEKSKSIKLRSELRKGIIEKNWEKRLKLRKKSRNGWSHINWQNCHKRTAWSKESERTKKGKRIRLKKDENVRFEVGHLIDIMSKKNVKSWELSIIISMKSVIEWCIAWSEIVWSVDI